MYVVLVGTPGVGKGTAVNPAVRIIKEAGTANLISDRVTIEFILEKLAKGFPTVAVASATNAATKQGLTFVNEASCIIASPELEVFLNASRSTISILTDLWDTKEYPYDYGTKTQGKFLINKPTINLLGGTTSKSLTDVPEFVVGAGFSRRVNFVYAKAQAKSIPWPLLNGNAHLGADLVEDLRHISTISGEVKFDAQARKLFETFYRDSIAKEFDDEATAAYRTTQWAHASKLAMAICVGEGDSKLITERQLQTAIDAIQEVRSTISLVFRAVGESDLVAAADRVMRYVELKGYASRQDIMRACWKHVGSTDQLDVILTTLTQGNILAEKMQGNKQMFEVIPTNPNP
jgi:hypothetical protein